MQMGDHEVGGGVCVWGGGGVKGHLVHGEMYPQSLTFKAITT